ncbi:MAG TPA: hypothetical protein VF131_26785 [Blastocatellia bacterium]|nr:hypothetical protein [Blastocatellia bacterium]
MGDVIIQGCTVRVVRRGGWSWGSDPKSSLQAVLQAFAELLARRFAELWPDESDFEITTPVRITIPLRLNELAALSRELLSGATEAGSSAAMLATRVERALRIIFEDICPPTATLKQNGQEPDSSLVEESSLLSDGRRKQRLLVLLSSWCERGVLSLRLASFSEAAIEAWHHALLSGDFQPSLIDSPSASDNANSVRAQALAIIQANVPALARPAVTRAARLRKRIELAVELFTRHMLSPDDRDVLSALDELLPIEATPVDKKETVRRVSVIEDGAQPARATETLVHQAAAIPRPLRATEMQVASALPFLLLGPLYRAGYLDALAATLASNELTSDLPLFAAALAYKALDPIERGWRRSSAAMSVAAAFAGLEGAVREDALVDFAKNVSAHLAPLDSVISETLIEGHNPAHPLLLHKTESAVCEFLLVDAEGAFPIACAASLRSLLPALMELGSPLLLIAKQAADSQLLNSLDEAGFYFITDARPTRHENWRQFRAMTREHWWTNDRAGPAASLAKAAQQLVIIEEAAAELWQELAIKRASIPLAQDKSLEHSLTLAASFALGTIAWVLWQNREPVTPLLALERFGDLDARIKFHSDLVEVKLPLGRRRQDLLDHGLLDDIHAVPWLGERAIRFAGG